MKRQLILLLLVGLVLACGGQKTDSEGAGSSLDEAVKTAESKGLFQAAKAYEGKLDQLLTLEMAAGTTGFPAEDASMDYNTTMKNASFHALTYTWDRGRTRPMKVATMTVEVPDLDRLELGGIQEISKDNFEFQYRVLTEEEKETAKHQMKSSLQDRVAKGEITQEQADLAGGMGEGLMGDQLREIVTGVGEAATWMPEEEKLYVYEDGLMFYLVLHQQASPEVLQEKLKALAGDILGKL